MVIAKDCGGRLSHSDGNLHLGPGQWHFSDANVLVRTTLGSCIAITLWHPQRLLGGICHFMLPARPGGSSTTWDARYAEDALQLLAQAASSAGTHLRHFQAKIFGGADMFRSTAPLPRGVAALNIAAAKTLAARHGLRVVAQDVGGVTYRQLIFAVVTGDVWVRWGAAPEQEQLVPGAVGKRPQAK